MMADSRALFWAGVCLQPPLVSAWGRFVQDRMVEAQISLGINVKKNVLRRVARCVQAKVWVVYVPASGGSAVGGPEGSVWDVCRSCWPCAAHSSGHWRLSMVTPGGPGTGGPMPHAPVCASRQLPVTGRSLPGDSAAHWHTRRYPDGPPLCIPLTLASTGEMTVAGSCGTRFSCAPQ